MVPTSKYDRFGSYAGFWAGLWTREGGHSATLHRFTSCCPQGCAKLQQASVPRPFYTKKSSSKWYFLFVVVFFRFYVTQQTYVPKQLFNACKASRTTPTKAVCWSLLEPNTAWPRLCTGVLCGCPQGTLLSWTHTGCFTVVDGFFPFVVDKDGCQIFGIVQRFGVFWFQKMLW